MFNVTRGPEPFTINSTTYNDPLLIKELHSIFLGKCYLCERDNLPDPEIEHFIPHKGIPSLKFKWGNLYYSCSRCNSLKSTTHVNLLDCCDADIDVFGLIECNMPAMPDKPILVKPTQTSANQTVLNTVALLDRCYNAEDTGIRGITRSGLIEDIFKYYSQLLGLRYLAIEKSTGQTERQHAKDRINQMLKTNFPFSVFWRWYIEGDNKLKLELAKP